jgi:hypothetical protein
VELDLYPLELEAIRRLILFRYRVVEMENNRIHYQINKDVLREGRMHGSYSAKDGSRVGISKNNAHMTRSC